MNNYGDYLTLPDNGDVVGYTDVFGTIRHRFTLHGATNRG